MKSGTCPKCGSKEVLGNLLLHGGNDVSPYVELQEPAPEKQPFIWTPKYEQSHFRAWICGACGYTEFYAGNHTGLHDGSKKGLVSK